MLLPLLNYFFHSSWIYKTYPYPCIPKGKNNSDHPNDHSVPCLNNPRIPHQIWNNAYPMHHGEISFARSYSYTYPLRIHLPTIQGFNISGWEPQRGARNQPAPANMFSWYFEEPMQYLYPNFRQPCRLAASYRGSGLPPCRRIVQTPRTVRKTCQWVSYPERSAAQRSWASG